MEKFTVTSITLSRIFPSYTFEISPESLRDHIGDYGDLIDLEGNPCRLVSVHIAENDHKAWAVSYFRRGRNLKWTNWIITTLSYTPLLEISR